MAFCRCNLEFQNYSKLKLRLGHRMGGYPMFCLMCMFNCTYTLTDRVFTLITGQLLKTHKERLFFYLSRNTADTLRDPSGATALFILFKWHKLIGKGGGNRGKRSEIHFKHQSGKRNHCLAFLKLQVKLKVSSLLHIRNAFTFPRNS